MRGRKKLERNLTTKPLFTSFAPTNKTAKDALRLTSDELEAIRLADLEELYHEECANRLNISRSTFSRTIKTARNKLAQMILLGKPIVIEEVNLPYSICYPSDDKISIATHAILAKFFVRATVENKKIVDMKFTPNPIVAKLEKEHIVLPPDHDGKGLEAGRILPEIFRGASVAIFAEIGAGLRRNIEGIGVVVLTTKERDIDKVVEGI